MQVSYTFTSVRQVLFASNDEVDVLTEDSNEMG